MLAPLTAQIVGSYTKPDWLIERDRAFRYDGSGWRVAPVCRDAARRDAALLAIYEQERAGLDMLTDGEAQRLAYDRHFYAQLRGVDTTTLGERNHMPGELPAGTCSANNSTKLKERAWLRTHVPRIVGEIGWPGPISVEELRFLKRQTRKPVKATLIGPLTSYEKLVDEYYRDEKAAVMAIAAALNEEAKALDAEGLDLLQIDEPSFHTRLSRAKRLGLQALDRVVEGVKAPIAVHVCYGYAYHNDNKARNPAYAEVLELLASSDRVAAISLEYEQPREEREVLRNCGDKHVILGLLNLGTDQVETAEHVAARILDALEIVPPERLHPSSDCGMWHLPRQIAFAKMEALALGTDQIRRELKFDGE